MLPLCKSALLVTLLALAGCASPIPVKSMVKNPGAYSATHFSRASIPFQADPALPAAGTVPMGFKQLTFKGVAEPAKPTPGQDLSLELQLFNDDDSGMLRSVERIDSNGLPISYLFEYTYHGLVPVAYQYAGLSREQAPATRYASDVTRRDKLLPLNCDTHYGYAYRLGFRSPLASSDPVTIECRSGVASPASTVIPEASGNLVVLTCRSRNKAGVVNIETEVAFLLDYGVGVTLHSKTADRQIRYRYTSMSQR
ncbi:lipoprotein [Bordetella trematum]|uniref:hypothetical protein n=1 Tax=Bordetella trematum TaxID=123899 RepID=UPI0007995515|nr:hypothetical protein [Bordetella trematum]AUL46214.1 hypothetical protein BTL55_03860 [Bordetella trematum]CZZ97260.1 lipoprotein [Bordetella trematum]